VSVRSRRNYIAVAIAAVCAIACGVSLAETPYNKVYEPVARPTAAQDKLLKTVRLDQKIGGQIPLDTPFKNEDGKDIHLGDYFTDKPVALVMIQLRCTMLCTEEMQVLMSSLRAMKFTPGKEFNLLIVSIDPREGPENSAAQKEAYVTSLNRPEAAKGWHFLTGSKESVDKLADAVGYHYVYDKTTDQFAHPDGVMIATPSGKLSRYFVRLSYPPRDLRLAMVEASEGKVGSILDAVALRCFHYNPATGKYSVELLGVLQIAGVATIIAMALGLVVLKHRERLRPQAAQAGRA
jgi:protein SCO1